MKNKTKKILFLIVFVILIIMIFYSKAIEKRTATSETFMMGTFIEIKAYGVNAEKAIQQSLDKISEIENNMSVNIDTSDVARINNNSGNYFQDVNDDTYFVIKKAIEYSILSKGAFDITIEPLISLWGVGTDRAKVPNDKEIKDAISYIDYKDIVLKNNSKVLLKKPGMAIDLGGIAKGYAADEIKKIMQYNGVKRAFINLGGNVYVMGSNTNKRDWNIGIQNPLGNKGEYIGILTLRDKSIVTSGAYERYFIEDNVRYHHIFDPRTGYPVENELISTTIISDKSIDGDALSTATYVLGLEKGLDIIESLEDVEAIFITNDKKVYTTSGLKGTFNLTNKGFKHEKRR